MTRIAALDRRVLVAGAIVVALLMAVSGRYGFHRDELYFLECARHLQGGYVDQPALAPLLARASLSVAGVSVTWLRLWPSLAAGATVVVGGLCARELGGGARAQLLAAVAAGTMPFVLVADHLANTTSYEFLAWAALGLVVLRVGRTGDPRWWLAGGVVTGLGVADNHLEASLAVVVTAAALLGGGRRMILNGWFLGGAAIAAAFAVPDVWWQAEHGWATLTMTHALNQENGGAGNIPAWVLGQLGAASLAMVWIWPVGIRFLWRSGRPLWRALVWAYAVLFVLFALTTGAQEYYLGGLYVPLLAAGVVSLDGWLHERPRRVRALLAGTAITTALVVLIGLPVLPARKGGPIESNNSESIGWPQLVASVRTVWTSLPPMQRASAVIFTQNYGEAAAVNELGRDSGLPVAVSGNNTFWWWGPGNPRATTVVAVMPGPGAGTDEEAYLRQYFTGVAAVATLRNPYGVENLEWGGHLYVCTGPRQPWGTMWPQLRHYD